MDKLLNDLSEINITNMPMKSIHCRGKSVMGKIMYNHHSRFLSLPHHFTRSKSLPVPQGTGKLLAWSEMMRE